MRGLLVFSICVFGLVCCNSGTLYGQHLWWHNEVQTPGNASVEGVVLDGAVNTDGGLITLIKAAGSDYTDSNQTTVSLDQGYSIIAHDLVGAIQNKADFQVVPISAKGEFFLDKIQVAPDDHIYLYGFTQGHFQVIFEDDQVEVNNENDERKSLLIIELDEDGEYVGNKEIKTSFPVYDFFNMTITKDKEFILLYALVKQQIDEANDENLIQHYVSHYKEDWSLKKEKGFSGHTQNSASPTNPGFLLYGMSIDKEGSIYLTGYLARGESTDLSADLSWDNSKNGALLVKLNGSLEYKWFRAVSADVAYPSAPVVYSDNAVAMYVSTAKSSNNARPEIIGSTNMFQNRSIDGYEGHIVKFEKAGETVWVHSVNIDLIPNVQSIKKYLAVSPNDELYVPMVVPASTGAMTLNTSDGTNIEITEEGGGSGTEFYGYQHFTSDGTYITHKTFERENGGRVDSELMILSYEGCRNFYMIGKFFGTLNLDLRNESSLINNSDDHADYFIASYDDEDVRVYRDEIDVIACGPLEIPFSFTDDDIPSLIFDFSISDESILSRDDVSLEIKENSGVIIINQFLKDGDVNLLLLVIDFCGTSQGTSFRIKSSPIVEVPELNVEENYIELCDGDTFVLASNFEDDNVWSTGAMEQSIEITESGKYWVKRINEYGCESITSDTVELVFINISERPIISASGPLEFCQGDSVVLTSSLPDGAVWSTGEKGESITVTENGFYSVLQYSELCGESPSSEPIEVIVHDLKEAPTILFEDGLRICEGEQLVLTSSEAENNVWSTGETSQQITVSVSGDYSVRTVIGECESPESEPMSVIVDQHFQLAMVSDTVFCPAQEDLLLIPSTDAPNPEYSWSDGSSASTLYVSEEGEYWLEVSSGACSEKVYVQVEEACYPVIHVPNAFSPNGDGFNETFEVFGRQLISFRIQIFNKWGNLLFNSNDIKSSWDGSYQGVPVDPGTYSYRIWYAGELEDQPVEFSQTGTLSLIK